MTPDQPRRTIAFVRAVCVGMNDDEIGEAEDNFRGVLTLLAAEAADRMASRIPPSDSTLLKDDSKIQLEAEMPPSP